MQPWPKSGPGWARCHAERRACSSRFSACTFVARERRCRGSPICIHDEAGPDLSRRAPALMSRCKLIYSVCCRQAFSRPGALLRRLCARHPTRFPPPVGKALRGRLLSPRLFLLPRRTSTRPAMKLAGSRRNATHRECDLQAAVPADLQTHRGLAQ